MNTNRQCTEPNFIAKKVSEFPDIHAWAVFWYAEPGYTGMLESALQLPGRRLVFEEHMALNPANDGDNYFTYMVSGQIMGRAAVYIDTHQCKNNLPSVTTPSSKRVIMAPDLEFPEEPYAAAETRNIA